jgi:hypothetical protein
MSLFAQEGSWQVSASSVAVLAAESAIVYRGAAAGLSADTVGSSTPDVVVVSAAEKDGSWTWTVLPVSTGAVSFTGRYLGADGKAVAAPPVAFTVTEAALPAAADIADIKAPLRAWPSPWPFLLAAALAFGAWRAWKEWKKRRRAPGGCALPATPALPPEVVAERAIGELRASGLWELNQAAYYLRLTDILRAYLEARYAKPVTAMTSVEVERLVKARARDLQIGGSIRELLLRADLVKFAKVRPAPDEGARDADLALSLIHATTPREFKAAEKKP